MHMLKIVSIFCNFLQVIRGKDIVTEMSHCHSLLSLIQCYMKAVLYCITFVSCLLFWPIAVLFIKYYNDGKYYLSKGNHVYYFCIINGSS